MTEHRGRGWLAVVIAAVLIGTGALAWAVTGRRADPIPQPTGSASPTAPPQQTMLVQVRDDQAVAVDNTLMSVADPRGRSSLLMVPARMLVDLSGPVPELPFGQTARLPAPDASQVSLANLVGARVDGSWVLDRLAFAGLVDAVGGVEVVVPEVLVVTDDSGVVTYTFPKGVQKLDGPEAAAYVQFLAPGAPEDRRLARFADVWRQVMLRLPPDRDRVVSILGSLGALSRSSIPTATVATFLLAWRADLILDRVDQRDLPVRSVTSVASVSTRLDFRAAVPVVEQLLAGALRVPAPDQPLRVLVEDVAGAPARIGTARTELRDAGDIPLTGGMASAAAAGSPSRVLVPPALPDAAARGRQVAAALRLPVSDVVVIEAGRTVADVTVLLGSDYSAATGPDTTATTPSGPGARASDTGRTGSTASGSTTASASTTAAP